MATTLGRMVTYLEGLLTIKLHNALITWSCKATLSHCKATYISTTRVPMTTWSWFWKVTWQTKIIIYSQPECLWLQTWQIDNLTRWVRTYKVRSPFYHVVLQDHLKGHLTSENHYISTTTVSVATKLARMVICLERRLIIKSYKVLIMWSCKVTWQTKAIIFL